MINPKNTVKNLYTEVESRTKEIYIAQHKNYAKDSTILIDFLRGV
jgi:hypothetical protein